jgi:hypothetical protein
VEGPGGNVARQAARAPVPRSRNRRGVPGLRFRCGRTSPAFGESIYDVDGFPYLTFYGVFEEMILRRVDEALGEKRLLALGIWRKIDMSIPTVGATRALRNMVDAGRVGRQ